MAKFCPECGAKTKAADAKFCVACGKAIGGAVPAATGSGAWLQMAGLAATAAFLGALAWGFLGIDSSKPESPSAPVPSGMAPAAERGLMTAPANSSGAPSTALAEGVVADPAGKSWDVRVRQVSERFLCGCGNCGDDTIWACDCDHRKGAQEMKAFIRDELGKGRTVEQIVESMKTSYGHFIG